MESDTNIPCATCSLWNTKKKTFYCDPNRCKKLSHWLLKHRRDMVTDPPNKIVQYIV